MNKQAVKKLKGIFVKMLDGNGKIRHWRGMKRVYGGGGEVGLDNAKEYIKSVKNKNYGKTS